MQRPVERQPFRRKALFERLEDRLLLLGGHRADRARRCRRPAELRGLSSALGLHGDLATALPVVGTTLGSAIDLRQPRSRRRSSRPAQAYLAGGGAKTTDGLVAALAGPLGAANITGDQVGDEIVFNVNLEPPARWRRCSISTSSANSLPITATANGTVDLSALIDFEFSFGFDLSEGIAPEEAFFIRVGKFDAKADVHTGNTINLGVALGFLDASIINGKLDIDADLSVAFNNPDADAAGRITATELLGTSLDTLVNITRPIATISATLPVNVSALGTFTGGGVGIALAGSPFAAPTMTVTGALASDVENFGRSRRPTSCRCSTRSATGSGAQPVGGDESGHSVRQRHAVQRDLDLAKAFSQSFTSQLIDSEGNVNFASAQQLVQKIATLLNMPESAVAANYNSSTNQLTFFLRMDKSLPSINAPVDFDLNLRRSSRLATASQLSISANGKAPVHARLRSLAVRGQARRRDAAPANSVLTSAATFFLSVDGAPAVLITVPPNASNTNRTQLATQINAALVAAGLPKVIASFDGAGKLNLTYASGTLIGARLDVTVPNVATNTAATQMGLQGSWRTSRRCCRTPSCATFAPPPRPTSMPRSMRPRTSGSSASASRAAPSPAMRRSTSRSAIRRRPRALPGSTSCSRTRQHRDLGQVTALAPPRHAADHRRRESPHARGCAARDVNMPNIFTPGTATIQFPDLQPLLNYQNLDLGDIVAGIQQLATYLTTIEGSRSSAPTCRCSTAASPT